MKGRAIYGGYDATRGIISLNIGAVAPDEVQKWAEQKYLDVEIDVPGKKRSLNANAYFHLLVSKIAEATHSTNTEVKNRLIRDNGQYEIINGKRPVYLVHKDFLEDMLLREDIHFKPEGFDGDRVRLAVMRGSHTYNTREMAHLIDMTVQEAKELDIETLPPQEIERMMKQWDVQVGIREKKANENSPLC